MMAEGYEDRIKTRHANRQRVLQEYPELIARGRQVMDIAGWGPQPGGKPQAASLACLGLLSKHPKGLTTTSLESNLGIPRASCSSFMAVLYKRQVVARGRYGAGGYTYWIPRETLERAFPPQRKQLALVPSGPEEDAMALVRQRAERKRDTLRRRVDKLSVDIESLTAERRKAMEEIVVWDRVLDVLNEGVLTNG